MILSDVDAIAPSADADSEDYMFYARKAGELVKVTGSPGSSLWVCQKSGINPGRRFN